jgi:hypothetical protein
MSQMISPSTGRRYGRRRTCQALAVPRPRCMPRGRAFSSRRRNVALRPHDRIPN